MKITLHRWWLAWLVSLSSAMAADMLPLCPTNLQFFPQKLPMHCRMPRSADSEAFPDPSQFPTLPPLPESYFQSLPPDKQPPPIPIPIPPFPGMPGAMPMPGPMGGQMPGPMGGPMPGMPGGMPMPMPMPVPMVGGPPHKLPVIVMPFYSQDHSIKKPRTEKPRKRREKRKPHKKKKKDRHSTETESSSCEESSESDHSDSNTSSEHGFWKGRRKAQARRKVSRRSNRHRMKKELKNKKKDILTPILQYVTKEGYVIFEKKISKSEAKDWLKEFKPQSEVNEIKEEIHEVNPERKPEEKRPEEDLFDPKSAEEFFKLDEAEKRLKAMEINKAISKDASPIEVTTRKAKRKHRPLRFNPLITNKE